MTGRKLMTVGLGIVLVTATVTIGISGTSTASTAPTGVSSNFHGKFAVLHTAKSDAENPLSGIPTSTFHYTYKSVTYRETFVGGSPKLGLSTSVPTYLIPIKLNYGTFVTDPTAPIGGGNSAVKQTKDSPIFHSSIDFVQGGTDLGTTQYVDAFQRAALWGMVKSHPTYHVLLGKPTVEPVQSVTVPTANGSLLTYNGATIILANINWFDSVAQAKLSSLSLPANSLPIFVTTQAFLSSNSGSSGCCIGGYHSFNGTYAYSEFSYLQKSGDFSQDVSALSHEIGEYVDDPYTDNTDIPSSCGSSAYEVGDPLENDANFGDYPYTVGGFTYHLQDLVLPPYFGAPAVTSVNGWDTFQGTPLSVCQNGG